MSGASTIAITGHFASPTHSAIVRPGCLTLGSMRNKSLEPVRNAAARALVKNLVENDFAGNVSAAAKRLSISQSLLYEFLDGKRGAGMKLLDAVSAYTHQPIDVIIGRKPQPEARSVDDALNLALAYHGEDAFAPRAVQGAIVRAAAGEKHTAPEWAELMANDGRLAVLSDRKAMTDGEKISAEIAAAKGATKAAKRRA